MRFVCAVLLCIVAGFGFIACNLVELDTAYALNQEIIEFKALGKTKVFTSGDLITAYERYVNNHFVIDKKNKIDYDRTEQYRREIEEDIEYEAKKMEEEACRVVK